MRFNVKEWNAVSELFTGSLLLGNGSSIAIDPNFNYSNLFSNAKLPENVKNIFDSFHSQDFEYILRKFTQATVINNIFNINCNDIHIAHSQVKKTLINTVKGIHPCIDKVRDKINNCANFIKQFDTIFSLNYDIMLYWAIMQVNDNHPYPLFKDCFNRSSFYEDFEEYREYRGNRSNLVFYPHGNLILAKNENDEELKLSIQGDNHLIDQISQNWDDHNYSPLFISEGTSEEKLKTIRSSNYLTRIYHEAIPTINDSLLILGWRMGIQDEHILKQIPFDKINHLGIVIFMNDNYEETCDYFDSRIRHFINPDEIDVHFIAHNSEALWAND